VSHNNQWFGLAIENYLATSQTKHDTHHNDVQHTDTQHNDTPHNDTQHNGPRGCLSIMYSKRGNTFLLILSAIILNVVLSSVVAPFLLRSYNTFKTDHRCRTMPLSTLTPTNLGSRDQFYKTFWPHLT